MDAVSLGISAASVVDLSVKLVQFLYRTKKGTESVDDDLQGLIDDIENLTRVTGLVSKAFKDNSKQSDAAIKTDDDILSIRRTASSTLKDCADALAMMESIVEKVKGEDGSSRFDRLRRHFRRLSKEEDFLRCRERLSNGYQALQMSLTMLDMFVIQS